MSKKKFSYFDAYSKLTEYAVKEAELLINIIENFKDADKIHSDLQKVHDIEHAGDEVNHEVFNNIAVDFITPIDREDLLDLAFSLDNILDQIEEIVRNFYILDVHKMNDGALVFAKIIKKSCEVLHECTKELPNYKKNRAKLREAIVKVNDAEDEADLVYMDVMRRLYTEENSKAMKAMV